VNVVRREKHLRVERNKINNKISIDAKIVMDLIEEKLSKEQIVNNTTNNNKFNLNLQECSNNGAPKRRETKYLICKR
jgi:hypothetical protein